MHISLSRLALILTLLLVILLSWYYIVFAMTMNMEPVTQWSIADIAILFCMWAIMMAGMMLPSAMPVILLVEQVNKKRKLRRASYTHTLFFVIGYLLIWGLYSAVITIIQYTLHHWALLSPMMSSANIAFSSAILLAAGIYQLTPLKQRCLQLCRSPLSVISSQWKEGKLGAILLGINHGQYCVGCCWILMAILFVTGVMNLKWILLLSLIVLVEKVLPYPEVASKLLGGALILLALSYWV